MQLRGYDLRYLITSLVLAEGASTTASLRGRLIDLGVDLGADPRRRLYGALRSEVRKGRLVRVGPATYGIDDMPRSTRDWVLRRARDVESALESGAEHPPARHRWSRQGSAA